MHKYTKLRKNGKAMPDDTDGKMKNDHEQGADEQQILEYDGGFSEWSPKHRCLVKEHLTVEMHNK